MFLKKNAPSPVIGTTFSNKDLLRLIMPLLGEQLLATMVGIVDTAMVSGVGESAIAAVSLVNTLNICLVQLFISMCAGGSIIAAQYFGNKDLANGRISSHQLLLSSVSIAAVLAVLLVAFNRPIMRLMDSGNDPVVFEMACTYLIITAISYPFTAIQSSGISLLRVMGNTKVSLYANIIVNIVNITGNAILIHPCGLGVAGAALATLLGHVVGSLIVCRLMFNPKLPLHFIKPGQPGFFRFKKDMIKRIMGLGIPSGIENSIFQFGRLLVTALVATLPTALRAAHGICNSVTSFAYLPNSALSLATVTVIGRLIGANKKEEAWYYGKKLLRWLYVALLPTNLILCCFSTPLVKMFNLSAEAVPVASQIVFLFGFFSIIMYAPAFGLGSILRAAGDVRYTVWVSIPSMLILRLGFSYLFVYAFDLSLLGVWLAMLLDWVARALGFLSRFLSRKWLDKRAI